MAVTGCPEPSLEVAGHREGLGVGDEETGQRAGDTQVLPGRGD